MSVRCRLGGGLIAIGCAWPAVARAEIYETFIDVQSPDELDELRRTDQIGGRTHRVLLELLRRGVALEEAPRSTLLALPNLTTMDVDAIVRARRRGTPVGTPEALIAAGLLDPSRAWALRGFVRPRPDVTDATDVADSSGGELRVETAWLAVDRRPPPIAVAVRSQPHPEIDLGFTLVSVRERPAPPRWDRVRGALIASRAPPTFEPALYHLAWASGPWNVVAGTYAIGFGQGLVIDSTHTTAPDGAVPVVAIARPLRPEDACAWEAAEGRRPSCDSTSPKRTPEFATPQAQRGVAVGFVRPSVSAHAFVWLRSPRMTANELAVPQRCGVRCEGVDVFAVERDPWAPALRWQQPHLRAVVTEIGTGGHVAGSPTPELSLGLTGYAVVPRWRVGGVRLDFAPVARAPPGGPYGALGLELAWARGPSRTRLDVAHGFDGRQRVGGAALILEQRLQWTRQQVVWHGRWYAPDYDNPWSGATAAVDRDEGLSTKDEIGSGLRFDGQLGAMTRLHAMLDLSSTARPRHLALQGRVRVEVRPIDTASIAVSSSGWHTRTSLAECGGTAAVSAFESADPEDTEPCGRSRVASGVRVGGTIRGRLDLALLGVHTVRSDRPTLAAVTHDGRATLSLRARFAKAFDVRARLSWTDDDILARSRGASTVATMVAPRIGVGSVDLEVRYDVRLAVDRRASTASRRPNPEHWIHGQLSWRF